MKIKLKQNYIFLIISIICLAITGILISYLPAAKIQHNGSPVAVMDGNYVYKYTFILDAYNNLGQDGITAYTNFHIIDFFFAFSYGMTMMALNLIVFPKKYKKLAIIIPLFPMLFDFIENTLIEIYSSRYPLIDINLAKTISVFTPLKWGFGVIWFLILLGFLCFRIYSVYKKRKTLYDNSLHKNN